MDESRKQNMEKALYDLKESTENGIYYGAKGMFWMFCFNMLWQPVKTIGTVLMCIMVVYTLIDIDISSGIILAALFILFGKFCKWLFWLFSGDRRGKTFHEFYFDRNNKKQTAFCNYACYHLLKDHFAKYSDLKISEDEIRQMMEALKN